jgi:hypothetical protein
MCLTIRQSVAIVIVGGSLTVAPSALARRIAPPHHRHGHHASVQYRLSATQVTGRPRTLPRPPD